MNDDALHILMVGSWEYSGSGKAMCYYAEALRAHGWQVEILSFSQPHDCTVNSSRFSSVPVRVAKNLHLPFDQSPHVGQALALVNDIVEWFLIHCKQRLLIWGHYLYPYAIACLVARSLVEWDDTRHTCIITPAGSDVWDAKQRLNPIFRETIKRPYRTTAVVYSHMFQKAAQKAYDFIQYWSVVSPVLPDSHFRPHKLKERIVCRNELGLSDTDIVIGIVGNMRPSKNIDRIVEVLDAFGMKKLSPTILLAGPDRGHSIDGYRLLKTGLIPDVRRAIWACDCTLNISKYDSFNLGVLESILCGVPALTSISAGIAQYVAEWEPACVFDLDSSESVHTTGHTLQTLILDRDKRQFLSGTLRRRAIASFGLSQNQRRLIRDIISLLPPSCGTKGDEYG